MLGLPLIDVCALEYVCMFNCRDVPFGAMTRAHTCTYVRVRVCVCVCVFGCVCALMFVYVGFRGLVHVRICYHAWAAVSMHEHNTQTRLHIFATCNIHVSAACCRLMAGLKRSARSHMSECS